MDGRALLAEPSAYTTVAEDASDTWGHGLDSFQPAVNGFSGASVQLVEEGPVRRVIRSVARYGASMITQEFFEYAGWDRLLVDVTLEWMEHHKVAKLRFAAAAGGGVMTEAPYSTQCREADGREYPGGSWIACSPPGASGSDSGFTVANDAKFSYDARPGSIGITVARSPISAHHDPALPDTDHAYEWLDQGVQRFTYAICGGSDPLPAARMAAGLLRPLRVISASGHPHGHLTPGIPRLTVDGATLGAVKRSEDGTGTVVRIHNPRLAASPAQVTFGDRSFHRTLAPTAVVTVHFPDYPDEPVREVGPMEDPFSGFAGS
jgi:alpha-mannosidase